MAEQQLKLIREAEMLELQKKIERMQLLVPLSGFTKAYFFELKTAKTYTEAFEKVNDEYYELFGQYRFSSWNSFRNAIKRKK